MIFQRSICEGSVTCEKEKENNKVVKANKNIFLLIIYYLFNNRKERKGRKKPAKGIAKNSLRILCVLSVLCGLFKTILYPSIQVSLLSIKDLF